MAISLKSAVAAPVAAYPALKASIVLFDCNPGTRSWTVPEGVSKIRAFVVGAGGGGTPTAASYGGGFSEKEITVTPGQVISYTVGAGGFNGAAGGTSSFGGAISATGSSFSAAGVGVGGAVNRSGGAGSVSANGGGGGAGHAFGDGEPGFGGAGGGFSNRRRGWVDGWRLGLMPGASASGGYGVGGDYSSPSNACVAFAGMGGGGVGAAPFSDGGIGGGAAGNASAYGGPGLVGIEVIA